MTTPSKRSDEERAEPTLYAFGEFVLDTKLFQLRKGAQVVPLEPKVFDVLRYLVEHHERVATKRELLDELWPNEIVTEAVLPTNINALRRALGQKRGEKQPIETIHGRGYRLSAHVTRSVAPRPTTSMLAPRASDIHDLTGQAHDAEEPFVGRVSLVSKLKRSLVRALGEQGQVVVLSGEAGVGKSRLAQRLAELARLHGADVWLGQCHDGDGAPALWPWIQVLRSAFHAEGAEGLRAMLGRGLSDVLGVLPELAESVDPQTPTPSQTLERANFRFLDGMSRLLVQAARQRPRVILLEDMHRADEASWQLLRLLVPVLERSAVLIVLTLRSRDDLTVAAPVQRNVDALARSPSCQRFFVRGLEEEETGELILALSGSEPRPEVVRLLQQRTGGNPLFIRELVEHETRDLTSVSTFAETPDSSPPEVVRHVLRRRVSRLGQEAQRTLEAAAVVGPRWDVSSVEAITKLSRETILASLDLAVELRIVLPLPERVDGYRFVHDLLRETLYVDLPQSQRKRMHLQAAKALEDRVSWLGAEGVREISHHLYQALPEGDPLTAIAWLRRAAEISEATQGFEDAARYLRMAIDASRMLPAGDPTVLEELSRARERALDLLRKSRIVD